MQHYLVTHLGHVCRVVGKLALPSTHPFLVVALGILHEWPKPALWSKKGVLTKEMIIFGPRQAWATQTPSPLLTLSHPTFSLVGHFSLAYESEVVATRWQ